jgi:predicted acyltransferase
MNPRPTTTSSRLVSLDQFRGYSVVGMVVVNFLAGLAAIPSVLKHNNTYFSLADSIMPAFLFAAGFSFRLTILRRIEQDGPAAAYGRAALRSLALILISLAIFGFDSGFTSWNSMTVSEVGEFVAALIKARLWNVLAIIGATQLLVLPVVAARPVVRIVTIVGLLVLHLLLSYSFNYEFVYARQNWMSDFWGAAGIRAWDGGFFGLLAWSVPVLAGTLAYDMCQTKTTPVGRLVGWGVALMILGYVLSCPARLYEGSPTESSQAPVADSPVWPPLSRLASRPWTSMISEPPFVEPPPAKVRPRSYWTMDKRVVTASFNLFGVGFSFALFGLFVLVCDVWGRQWWLFRMFGQNPLAAYLLHYPIMHAIRAIVPKDSPLWWCLVGLAACFAILVLFVRFLDRHKLYVRL